MKMDKDQLKRHIHKSDLTAIEKRYLEGLVDAEPVRHGRCISDIYGMKCSECDRDLYENSINFCPNCGAKMDGE